MWNSTYWAFKERLRGLRRDAQTLFLSVLLAALALSIPFFLFSLRLPLAKPIQTLSPSVEVTVFCEGDVPQRLPEKILKLEGVSQTQILDKDDVFNELNQSLGIKKKTPDNPLPDVVITTLHPDVTPEKMIYITDKIEKLPGVDMVAYDTDWHVRYSALSQTLFVGLSFLGGLICLLVSIGLWSALRLATYTAGSELKTFYVLGARPWFAVRPWVWRGSCMLGLGRATACMISYAGLEVIKPSVLELAKLYDIAVTWRHPPLLWTFYFILGNALLGGCIAARIALNAWYKIVKRSA